VAELSWPDRRNTPTTDVSAPDPDRLINRLRNRFALVLTVYAVASLIAAFPPVATYSQHPQAQIALAMAAGMCALAAMPAVLCHCRWPAWIAGAVLAGVAVVQPALLTHQELTRDANWSQAVIGFCVLPLLLESSAVRAVSTLVAYWAVPALIALVRNPSEQMAVFLGLCLAGTLIPQLFASLFNGWARRAADDARAETAGRLRVVTEEKVTEAIQADYLKRYSDVMENVVPLLRIIGRGEPITPELQRQARAESRRLRMLFDELKGDHPLLFEMRAVIDRAEERGIDVSAHFDDAELPTLDQTDIDRITAAVDRVIAVAAGPARIVVTVLDGQIDCSVVCEVSEADAARGVHFDGEDIELLWSERTLWMTIRHQVRSGADTPSSGMEHQR
jgi:hypothetical protein